MRGADLFPLTGTVTWAGGGVAPGVFVMAVDRSQLYAQYRTLADGSGSYSLDVPAGWYDLFFDEIGGQGCTHIRSGVLVAKATKLDATVSRTQTARGVIGNADDFSTAPSEWKVVAEALAPGRERGAVASEAFLDRQGRFDLGVLSPGYYLAKLAHAESGRSYDVLLPVGDKPVMLTFDVGTAAPSNTHAADLLSLPCACASPRPNRASMEFTQSAEFRKGVREVIFSDGLLSVTAPSEPAMYLRARLPYLGTPTTYCINAHDVISSVIFKYAVTVVTLFGWSNDCTALPSGTWKFQDQEGDTYNLIAVLPYPHTVGYNSNLPDIVRAVCNPT
jgi:hypothetical protein